MGEREDLSAERDRINSRLAELEAEAAHEVESAVEEAAGDVGETVQEAEQEIEQEAHEAASDVVEESPHLDETDHDAVYHGIVERLRADGHIPAASPAAEAVEEIEQEVPHEEHLHVEAHEHHEGEEHHEEAPAADPIKPRSNHWWFR